MSAVSATRSFFKRSGLLARAIGESGGSSGGWSVTARSDGNAFSRFAPMQKSKAHAPVGGVTVIGSHQSLERLSSHFSVPFTQSPRKRKSKILAASSVALDNSR
jgi:hypothetical protein